MTQNCCRLSSKVALAKSIVTSALTRSREKRREINITPELILKLQWVQLKSNILNIIRVVVQAAVIFPMVGLEFWCDFLSLFDKMFWLVVGCVTSCLAVKTQPSPTPVYWRLSTGDWCTGAHTDTDTGSLLAGGQSSPLLLPPGQQQRGGRQHKDQLLWLAAVDIYTCGEEMRKIPIRFFVFYLLLPDSDKIKKITINLWPGRTENLLTQHQYIDEVH